MVSASTLNLYARGQAALLLETECEDKAEEMEAPAQAIRAKHVEQSPVQ